MRAAIFLDRDGVLVDDLGAAPYVHSERPLPGVAAGLTMLRRAGYLLFTVSNQARVARGWVSEHDVRGEQDRIEQSIMVQGGPALDGFYFCPHHPHADDPRYREHCACRKPRPGMIDTACRDHEIDARRSYLVGDRMSDLVAGMRAGCRLVWVQSGRHEDPPIVGAADERAEPHHVCKDLESAARFIVGAVAS